MRSANDTLCYAQWTGNEWQIDRLLASPSEIISAAAAVAPNRESHIVVTTADNKNPYHCMAIYMHGTVPLFINKGGVATECFNCFDYDTVMYWRAGADLISPTALALTRAGVPLVAYNAEFCSGLGECSGSIMLAQRRPTVSVESPSNAVVASGLNVAAIGFPAASGALRLAIQSSLTQAVMIDVYDIQGRAAATERIVRVVPGVAGYDVQVGHLGRGVYFLRARGSREGATTTKLVVAR